MFTLLCCCPTAHALDTVVSSFDGTRIVTHFYAAKRSGPSPTVLVGPGYGKAGNTSPESNVSDVIGAHTLRSVGYNVLTWDPRGTGGSGGNAHFNSPDFEARDVQALIDFVAAQPDALLDGPGDPRVGMSGTSYGGAIQFVSAALDPRIDAIVPDQAWHSLATSLFKDGALKAGWFTAICAGGEATALLPGLISTHGIELGTTATQLKRACIEGIAQGTVSAASRQWFADHGPGMLIDRVKAPTLILAGSSDALFPPSEAIANYAILRAHDIPVKMMWYCGGHGQCQTPAGQPGYVATAAVAWLNRWLMRDRSVDTGPRFEWVSDDGVWRSSPDFPLATKGTIDTAGSGGLAMTALDSVNSGLLTFATPALTGVTVRFPAAPEASDVLGEPRLRLTYSGTALPTHTFLYAQIIDARGHRVIGVQVTPIPVVLDGRTRTVERPLEPIAVRAGEASDYRLQITAGTTVYSLQRATGLVRLNRIEASLPIVDPTRSPRLARSAPTGRVSKGLRTSVSSRRVRGRARIVLRARLLSKPCGGSVTFDVRVAGRRHVATARISTSTCFATKILRLKVAPGRRARLAARFNGNAALDPHAARSIVRRLR
jgi:ABC-2 type transport system ATP-binding protein